MAKRKGVISLPENDLDDWVERDTPDELAIQMFMNAATLLGQTFLKKAGAFLEDDNDDYEVVRILK